MQFSQTLADLQLLPFAARMFITLLIRMALTLAGACMLLTVCFAVVPPVSSVMLQSWLSGRGMVRDWVPIAHIAPAVQRAVIAGEDARFCQHHGIDWQAAEAAYKRNERQGRISHGASTLSMQTAKNLFLWNGRSWLRKALEAPLALWLDLVLSKRRVLEIYLNTAEWGTGVFGIEAASQRAFGKPAYLLSDTEASLLAAALPAPRERNAASPTPAQRALAATIRARMGAANIACLR